MYKAPVLLVNQKMESGRIYIEEVLTNSIQKIQNKIDNKTMLVYICNGGTNPNLVDAVGYVDSVYIENSKLYANFEFLNGKEQATDNIEVDIYAIGEVIDNNVYNYNINYFYFSIKDERWNSWKESIIEIQ